MRCQQIRKRRAVVLLVVLSLLTLFAVVGVAFVLYADAEAAAARVAREAQTLQSADVDPQLALAFFLGQFVYDLPDSAAGAASGLRGHSLARTMYGLHSASSNVVPFNGLGRVHTGTTWPYLNPYALDDHLLPNYTWFQGDGFVRDPEWYGTMQTAPTAGKGTSTFYVGGNAPYTYPDLNSFFLAAVRSDGVVLTPSFHRPWLFGPLGPNNPNWTNPQGKYLTLRPRPNEHPHFPYPENASGDVRNIPWSTTNDSIWIDPGAPVMKAPDGTPFKMLFAPCIIDLDNRINLGTAGNIEGNNIAGLSNQGWFPSEINLSKLWSTSTTNAAEWLNLFKGNPPTTPPTGYYGKYGRNQAPDGLIFPSGNPGHVYAPGDLDGRDEISGAATGPMILPTSSTGNVNPCFPNFPQGYGCGSIQERRNHPAKYNVYKSAFSNAAVPNDDIVFRPCDMEALLRPNLPLLRPNSTARTSVDAGSSALISRVLLLCSNSLGAMDSSALQRRNWITTVSSDLSRPGLSPWLYNPSNPAVQPYSRYSINPARPALPPRGNALTFPTGAERGQALPVGSDFTANWRAADAAEILGVVLGRIDLNRQLPAFPHMQRGLTPPLLGANPNVRFDSDAAAVAASHTAILARQLFADDIYRRLLAVTGANVPFTNPGNPLAGSAVDLANVAAQRWLAQLAVNIVDYIDADEISTPFNFYTAADGAANIYQLIPTTNTFPKHAAGNPDLPAYWVFGTELPRLVINEVLGEYLLPTDNGNPATAENGPILNGVRVWVELLNPLPGAWNSTAAANATASLQAMDSLPEPLYYAAQNNGANPAYNPYELRIANNNIVVNAQGLCYNAANVNANVLGTPQQQRFVSLAGSTPAGCYFGTLGDPVPPAGLLPQTYMIVGPPGNDVHNDIIVATPATTSWLQAPNMQYAADYNAQTQQWDINGVPVSDSVNGISVLLRRLANPHMPPNPYLAVGGLLNPAWPPNPYITADYAHQVSLNGYGLSNNNPVPIDQILNPTSGKPAPPNSSPVPPASLGKLQPYGSDYNQFVSQITLSGTVNHHTLGLPNQPLASPFTWLVHLDRVLISPMELLHVSGFHPHELSQRFIVGKIDPQNGGLVPQPYNYPDPAIVPVAPADYVAGSFAYFQHHAPWFDQRRRLYRFFELADTRVGACGISAVNGRIPGKININTLWDPPALYPFLYQAIADPPLAANADNPNFTAAKVSTIFQTLLTLRTPGLAAATLSQVDRPFLGMAAGVTAAGDSQYPAAYGFPNGNGINHTLLTSGVPGTQPLSAGALGQGPALQLPNPAPPANIQIAHPYLQNELLTKIYGRVTTRSNVFAVFLTVGFFEVTGTVAGSPNLPQLGAEIGRSEGKQIRHRMFAIVDRTNLSVMSPPYPTFTGPQPIAVPTLSGSPPLPFPVTFSASGGVNAYTGTAWVIGPGSMATFEPGSDNEETVVLQAGAQPGQFQATFFNSHAVGVPVIVRGNPGPWTVPYVTPLDPGVVLYYSIID